MSVMVIDTGNSIIKAKIGRRERSEIAFPHAFRQISESEYEKILSRVQINGNTRDYYRVNGTPYVIGESAERHGLITQRTGTARYTKDYCGVLAAITLFMLYARGREVAVFASHPPGDVKYREDLMRSIIGEWEIGTGQSKANFRVIYANTFDEPVGGLMNVLLTEDGQHYQYPQIGDGRSLVIDIGGFTTDFLAVNQGGKVDYALARYFVSLQASRLTFSITCLRFCSEPCFDYSQNLHFARRPLLRSRSGFMLGWAAFTLCNQQ